MQIPQQPRSKFQGVCCRDFVGISASLLQGGAVSPRLLAALRATAAVVQAMMLRAGVVLAVVKLADAHGSMSQPRSRQQHGLNIDGSNCAPPQRFAPRPALRWPAAHRCCSRMLLTRGPCPGDPSKFGNSAACTAACMGEACEWFNGKCNTPLRSALLCTHLRLCASATHLCGRNSRSAIQTAA